MNRSQEIEYVDEVYETQYEDEPQKVAPTSKNSNVSRTELEDLEDELFILALERRKFHANVGTDLLHAEPEIFREHSFKSSRPGSAVLPPKAPSPTVGTTPLKSCLKASKEKQRPRAQMMYCDASSQNNSSVASSSPSTPIPKSCMEHIPACSSSPSQPIPMSLQTESTMPRSQKDTDRVEYKSFDLTINSETEWAPLLEPVDKLSHSNTPSSRPASLATSERKAALSTVPSAPEFSTSDSTISRPTTLVHAAEHEPLESPVVPESRKDLVSSMSNSSINAAESMESVPSSLPPRYASTSDSWQEDRESELLYAEECKECESPDLFLGQGNCDDTTGCSEEETFIASLDSEAATNRLIAEVIAVQSRLEDCKLKPLDFREFLTEPSYPARRKPRVKQGTSAEKTDDKDSHDLNPLQESEIHFAQGEDYNFNSATDFEIGEEQEPNAERVVEDQSIGREENFLSAALCGATVSDHDQSGQTIKEYVTGDETLEEMESEGKLQGTAWEIKWKDASKPQLRKKHLNPENVLLPSSPTTVNSGQPGLQPRMLPTSLAKSEQSEMINDQKAPPKHVMIQTEVNMNRDRDTPSCLSSPTRLPSDSLLKSEEAYPDEDGLLSDPSLRTMERPSRYTNIGYRDLSEPPHTKLHKQHCFYSTQGPIQSGYSQPRSPPQIPQSPKQDAPQDNRYHVCHDSLGDKENYSVGVHVEWSDDQELSILASLERLDWKLAAISARGLNKATPAPSVVSQGQSSIKSAPAMMGHFGVPAEGRARKPAIYPLRPSVCFL